MMRIDRKYEELGRILSESSGETLEFREICRRLGVSPADMEEIIESELGVDGDEMMQYFANGWKIC